MSCNISAIVDPYYMLEFLLSQFFGFHKHQTSASYVYDTSGVIENGTVTVTSVADTAGLETCDNSCGNYVRANQIEGGGPFKITPLDLEAFMLTHSSNEQRNNYC